MYIFSSAELRRNLNGKALALFVQFVFKKTFMFETTFVLFVQFVFK